MATSTVSTSRQPGPDGAGTQPPGTRRAALRGFLHRLDVKAMPYVFVAPFFVLFAAVGLFPLAYTAYVSLNDWSLTDSSGHSWSGLDNYSRLIHDERFWNALQNTVSIWLLSTVPQLVLALVLAAALNTGLRARTFLRVGAVVPVATSIVAVAIVFSQLFATDFGLVNWVLGGFGVDPINWRATKLSSHVAISVMIIWQWTGYNALIYLAGMQAISRDLYEAAELDGAGAVQRFLRITIPMLRPTILFTVVISTIGGLQVFAQPLLFDTTPGNVTGGADRQFQTLTLFMYEQGFRVFNFGYASAVAWTLFLIIAVISAVVFVTTRRSLR